MAKSRGITLDVAYGAAEPNEAPQSTAHAMLPHSIPVKNRRLPGTSAIWQCVPVAMDYDLVIVEQANRLLLNYALIAQRSLISRPARLAYWAHGRNWQGDEDSYRERWKRALRKSADFWFCYTDRVVQSLDDVPESRKCSVNNAIDTAGLSIAVAYAASTGVKKDPNHLVFIGSMRADKRLPWIFEAVDSAHDRNPNLTINFIGDGPVASKVVAFCEARPWACYSGALHGTETAAHLWRAAGILMPGLVGLVALDSFVAEAPILTTPFEGKHSPEFAYLQSGYNALVSDDTPQAYTNMVCQFISDTGSQETLRAGCRASASSYSIERMAERFVSGIEQALALPPRRSS